MENFGSLPLQNKNADDKMSGIVGDMNELSSRLKVLEDRQANLRRKNQLTEQNMLNINKKLASDIKTLSLGLSETKKQVDEVSERLLQFMHEIKKCAKKEDLNLLERYLEFWNPINFLTRKEAEKLVEDSLKKEE